MTIKNCNIAYEFVT